MPSGAVGKLDLGTGKIRVRPETPKTRRGQVFRLTPQTLPFVRASVALSPDREALFAWDRSKSYLWSAFAKLLKAAGLPTDSKSKFHCILKTSATMIELHVGEGAATKWLGHTKRSITEDYYLDLDQLPESNMGASLPRPTSN